MRFTVELVVVALSLTALGCGDETTTVADEPFECSALDRGQSLAGTATVDGSDLRVSITSDNGKFTEAPTVTDVSSGTLGTVTVEMGIVRVPISGVGSSVSFKLAGRLIGPVGDFCDVERTFNVNVNADGATVQ